MALIETDDYDYDAHYHLVDCIFRILILIQYHVVENMYCAIASLF